MNPGDAPIIRVGVVPSTQQIARELAEAGCPHGTLVSAAGQSAGRGTRGRVWTGEPGINAYVSVVLRPGGSVRHAPLLSLGLAAALAERLGVWVKWPNDMVDSEGRKLAGILGELEIKPDGSWYAILGIGLNINQTTFPPDLPNATSLARLHQAPQDIDATLQHIFAACREGSTHPDRLTRWRARARTLGRQVEIHEGPQVITGRATDIQDDGGLLLDTPTGPQTVYAGVVFEGASPEV